RLRAAPQPRAAAGREPSRPRRFRSRAREAVVVAEGAREAEPAQQPDLNDGREAAEQVAGPDADVVVEVGSTVLAGLEPRLHAHLGDRPAAIAAHDPEPFRPQPL